MTGHADAMRRLDAAGAFSGAPWVREAMNAVRREAFVPDVIWRDDGDLYTRVDRRTDPAGWAAVVGGRGPVVTQVDDGADAEHGEVATSSVSDRLAVVNFLTALDVHPGQRVWEVGTGSGWTAALLAYRVGPTGRVVTVEIDRALADAARARLGAFANTVEVVTGDGEDGAPATGAGGRWDRVHITAAVTRRLPHTWVEHAKSGAVLVLPFSPPFGSGSLLRLVVGDDGTASGRFVKSVAFMPLRGQRGSGHDVFEEIRTAHPDHDTHPVDWHLAGVSADGNHIQALALKLPDVHRAIGKGGAKWWLHDGKDSWALVDDTPDAGHAVQGGPRRLWDEVTAILAWQDDAEIHAYDFGVTVEPDAQWAWAGAPGRRWRM
ncbi:protein-L-isoaspartate(D-aspartate) O-methyltransferase [Embleya sp. NBC_00896]|uniref:protein-L-isoaspartate(D-aspartate) O-methyltransferase n=1 Tax=Embleya sp. NBC_00896 TaxID=2975961 RepID=UPI002F90A3EE|nr:protein-L-isoaspartate(D-aspartate) O-methyltransferase [Embleya sp. NBC_00896]